MLHGPGLSCVGLGAMPSACGGRASACGAGLSACPARVSACGARLSACAASLRRSRATSSAIPGPSPHRARGRYARPARRCPRAGAHAPCVLESAVEARRGEARAQVIGRLPAHPHRARRLRHPPALRQRFQKGDDLGLGPAIVRGAPARLGGGGRGGGRIGGGGGVVHLRAWATAAAM